MFGHWMIDLETLSTSARAGIISIGAIEFDPFGEDMMEPFYINVSWEDAFAFGEVDPKTIKFWLGADEAARKELLGRKEYSYIEALSLLRNHLTRNGPVKGVWGNGSMFDISILEYAYGQLKLNLPWTYKAPRDFRTLRAMCSELDYKQFMGEGIAHSALDDAIAQARCLQAILRKLAITGFE